MIDSLINTIEERVVLNEKDILLCEGYFEPILYPKNRIIEEEGQKNPFKAVARKIMAQEPETL